MKDKCERCEGPATVHNRHGDFCPMHWAEKIAEINKAGLGVPAVQGEPIQGTVQAPVVAAQPVGPPEWFLAMLEAYDTMKVANVDITLARKLAWSVLKGEIKR